MSPIVFKIKRYKFLFFSREEKRMHIHVQSPDGEAKFWLEPVVALVEHYGLLSKEIKEIQKIIEEHYDEIKKAWKAHFKS